MFATFIERLDVSLARDPEVHDKVSRMNLATDVWLSLPFATVRGSVFSVFRPRMILIQLPLSFH
ncbi:MAG: hypothetical protein U1D30_17145 [Planctomycetota bacterium]